VRRRFGFPAGLTTIFLAAVLFQISRHVMWRDELRTWQIARDSSGLISLNRNMQYDAVPFVWNSIVFVLTRFFDSPVAMQIVHAFIAAAVVFVVARWSPFPRFAVVLFAIGYFPLFEYAVIARSYALTFLLITIACALIAQPRVRLLWLAAVLFLLAQVSVWSPLFAGLLLAAGTAKVVLGNPDSRPDPKTLAAAALIVLAGGVLCLFQLFPGPGPSFTSGWRGVLPSRRVVRTIATIFRGLVPIPVPGEHFWNTNVLDEIPITQAVIGVSILGLIGLTIARRPVALGMFVVGAVSLVAFTGLRFRGANRHHGYLFMLTIATFWMAAATPEWRRIGSRWERRRNRLLTTILAVNAIAGLVAVTAGLIYPFSATLAAAQFIESTFGDTVIVAAVRDFSAAPLAQWLDRPLYFPEVGAYARYNTQDDLVHTNPDQDEILRLLYAQAMAERKNVLLVLNTHLPQISQIPIGEEQRFEVDDRRTGTRAEVGVRCVAVFDRSVVEDESHWIYLVRPINW
jgi:hypothetical protein